MWLAVGAAAYLLLDKILKKKQSANGGDNRGGNDAPPNTQVVIGKNAFAISDDTKVRSSPSVNNGTINNIGGVLKKDELAGKITSESKGADGKTWYLVMRAKQYDCPLSICGLTRSYYGGYVRSDVVRVA